MMQSIITTIQDSLSPDQFEALAQVFDLDEEDFHWVEGGPFIEDEWLEALMGFITSSHLWDAMWRFGIVLDDDAAKVVRLGSYWRPDGGLLDTRYYVPDDYDTTVSCIDIDHPPMEDAAWDARPV
jgi:hypothetical protein